MIKNRPAVATRSRLVAACFLLFPLAGCRGSSEPSIPDVDYRAKGDHAACEFGPWSKHCPSAFWLRDVVAFAGRSMDGDTGSALETDGVFVWVTDADGPPHGDVVGEIEGLEIHGDGVRLAWTVHGLIVWAAPGSSNLNDVSPSDIEDLVEASKKVPYP